MDLLETFKDLQATPLAVWVREGKNVLAFVNGFHILGVALVFGTIFIVDLRLLGFPNASQPLSQVRSSAKLTWVGFALAAITGTAMFVANAEIYYSNRMFWLKMGTIALAGVNMLIFELLTARTAASWDRGQPPTAARVAGLLSILLWVTVVVCGRWIGFTKHITVVDVPIDLNNLGFGK